MSTDPSRPPGHALEYLGRDEAGNYGWHCPECSRSVRLCLSPLRKTVLFAGDASVPHGIRIGGLSVTAGPVITGSPVTSRDRDFLAGHGITW